MAASGIAPHELMIETLRKRHSRLRTETALRESETRFRHLADTAPVLLWMTDEHNRCAYVNKGWLDFTGRTMEQELGHGWINGIHPDDRQGCLAVYTAAFTARQPFEMEVRLKHASGRYRWVLDRGVPRFSSDGTFLGYTGSCSDISERKRHEEAIRQYNQLLEEEVKTRTVRIQELEQRRMQVEKLAALSQVAAGVAHEINNPLASIQQSFELVKRMLSPDHPRFRYVKQIDREIDRIACIIKQMYQLHRPRHSYPKLIDLGEAARDAVDLIKGFHKNQSVRVRLDIAKKALALPLPSTELHQVLCNILQNAFDAVEPEGAITVRTGMNTGRVWIAIQDNGPGMSPDVLSHIFDPFFSTKGHGEGAGMGLGLSVSRSLVEAMGGALDVDSTPGRGTTFTIAFSLPIIPAFQHDEGEARHAVSR